MGSAFSIRLDEVTFNLVEQEQLKNPYDSKNTIILKAILKAYGSHVLPADNKKAS